LPDLRRVRATVVKTPRRPATGANLVAADRSDDFGSRARRAAAKTVVTPAKL